MNTKIKKESKKSLKKEMKKTFILDTNVLLSDSECLRSFQDNDVVLPLIVVEELDRFKDKQDDVGKHAREISRQLIELVKENRRDVKKGISLGKEYGVLKILNQKDLESNVIISIPELDYSKGDNKIVQFCLEYKQKFSEEKVILVTRDLLLRIKAISVGIECEDYKKLSKDIAKISNMPASESEFFTGVKTFKVSKEELDKFYEEKNNIVLTEEEEKGLYPNQFIVFESNETDAKIAGRFLKPGKPLKFVSFQQSAWNIKNKNMEQAFLMDLLMDDSVSLVTVNSRSGAGKAQPLDAKILTPTGWTTMGKIKRGDFVIGKNGKPTKVTGIFPQGVKNIYRVTFSDKSSTECCEDHLWQITDNRKPKEKKATKVVSLKDIKDNLKTAGNRKIYKIPMVDNIEFVEKPVELDPYVLGVLLGDGCFGKHSITLSSSDKEIVDHLQQKLKNKIELKYIGRYDYRLKRVGSKKENFIIESLKNLNLNEKHSWEKFIPDTYKYNSQEIRLNLLQGLMDTDGYVSKRGDTIIYYTSSKKLAEDIQELVWSFGGKAVICNKQTNYFYKGQIKDGRPSYAVHLSLPAGIIPFKLDRKKNRFKPRIKYQPIRLIEKVEFIGRKEAQCISVAAEDHLYVTDDYIVTHNTLVSLACALELTLSKKKYNKILITRNIQPLGKDIGALPGPQPLDAKILTPTGWTTMGKIKVGDLIISRDGKPTKVIGVFPKGKKEVYKITTTEGQVTECCEDHLWETRSFEEIKRGKKGQVRSTKELKENLTKKTKGHSVPNFYIPRNEPVQYNLSADVKIPGYTMGVLIGDGSIVNNVSFASIDKEIIERVKNELKTLGCCVNFIGDVNYNIKDETKVSNKKANLVEILNESTNEKAQFLSVGQASKILNINKSTLGYRCKNNAQIDGKTYKFIKNENLYSNKIKNILNYYKLLGTYSYNKFIPKEYLYNSSIETRIALLQGLMDTDGTIKQNGEASFTTVSEQLKNDFIELVYGLGGKAIAYKRKPKTSLYEGQIIKGNFYNYDIRINLPNEINPFFLKRKANRRKKSYMHHIGIKSIEKIGLKKVQCIRVENKEHLYITDNFIVTHNTAEEKLSPWIAPFKDNLEFLLNENIDDAVAKGAVKSKKSENLKHSFGMQDLFERGIIQIEATTFIRGRSIPKCIFLVDESQNLSLHEMKTILTRVGEGTKIVLLGDYNQIDSTYLNKFTNGLTIATEKFKNEEVAGHVTLVKGERSKLATIASDIL